MKKGKKMSWRSQIKIQDRRTLKNKQKKWK